ncbi:MAG: glycosyltransferase family 2 protein [Anaerolineales bacterium]|nr:glycosyltransferase family 2 protein [Anaerolineales bacterium]
MLTFLVTLLSLGLFAILAVFAARRLVFLFTLGRAQPPLPERPAPGAAGEQGAAWPAVLVLVPARNERASLPGLIAALEALDYPRWRVMLIDDGSTDGTGALMAAAAAERPGWRVLGLPRNLGKPAALNAALAAEPFGEIVFIFDVDHRPRPDCLRPAVRAFADPRVAGVSGRTVPRNALDSPVAYYAAVENLVHQLVTMRGKDVLGLAPALLGSNNGYRRSALTAVGGFRPGAFLEDSDLTLSLYRAGWTVRYVPEAVATLEVPYTVRGFARQHLRWGRGFNDVARAHLPALLRDARLPAGLRLELALFSVGYLDRLALLGMVGVLALSAPLGAGLAQTLAALGVAVSLGLPLLQIAAALLFDRAPWAMWRPLPWVPVFFAVDAGVAVWAALLSVFNRPRRWTQTERSPAARKP